MTTLIEGDLVGQAPVSEQKKSIKVQIKAIIFDKL
jgi:hypothetical protein